MAFPLLASGNNRFDLGLALEIAIQSIDSFDPVNKLEQVYLVLFGMRVVALAKERGFEVDEKSTHNMNWKRMNPTRMEYSEQRIR